MKKYLLLLTLLAPIGCKSATSTTPPAALAPGYSSQDDQVLGQSLASLNAFVLQEKTNYAALAPAQQAAEKSILNALIDATDVANATYTAFHQGTGTLAQAQVAYATAQSKETALNANKGVQ